MTIVVGRARTANFLKVSSPRLSSRSARKRMNDLSRKGWNLELA
jgi:hypothetical protein